MLVPGRNTGFRLCLMLRLKAYIVVSTRFPLTSGCSQEDSMEAFNCDIRWLTSIAPKTFSEQSLTWWDTWQRSRTKGAGVRERCLRSASWWCEGWWNQETPDYCLGWSLKVKARMHDVGATSDRTTDFDRVDSLSPRQVKTHLNRIFLHEAVFTWYYSKDI
jgi:hypothetical protein